MDEFGWMECLRIVWPTKILSNSNIYIIYKRILLEDSFYCTRSCLINIKVQPWTQSSKVFERAIAEIRHKSTSSTPNQSSDHTVHLCGCLSRGLVSLKILGRMLISINMKTWIPREAHHVQRCPSLGLSFLWVLNSPRFQIGATFFNCS